MNGSLDSQARFGSLPGSAVLFDLDGTLIDTAPDFVRCLNLVRQQAGLPALPADHIRPHVSDGARAMVRLGFGLEPEDERYPERHTAFLAAYARDLCVDTCLFPGMEQLLQGLESRGIPWGIVTNKPERFAVPLIAALGLAERCGTLICPDHVTERKPHPEGLHLACRQLGVEPSGAVYVGDHVRDIEAGRNAGMTTVAVRYGYIVDITEVEHWQADHTVDTVDQLLKLLQ